MPTLLRLSHTSRFRILPVLSGLKSVADGIDAAGVYETILLKAVTELFQSGSRLVCNLRLLYSSMLLIEYELLSLFVEGFK